MSCRENRKLFSNIPRLDKNDLLWSPSQEDEDALIALE